MKLEPQQFIAHACEQVLRFTAVADWDDLSEERKVQLGFNMGVVALGLGLSKEDGYVQLANTRSGEQSPADLHQHMRNLVQQHNIAINEENVIKTFYDIKNILAP